MKKFIFTFLLMIFFISLNAQTEVLKDNGSWLTLVNKFTITDNLNVLNVVQQRRVGFLSETQAFLFAPSVNYKIAKNVSVGAGYMHYYAYPNGVSHASIRKEENRFFQDLKINSMLNSIKLNHRFRFEERVIDVVDTNVFPNVINGDKYVNRFRYRFQATFNLMKINSGKTIYGKISNEIRIRFGNGITEPDFDQNNFKAVLGYKLVPNSMIWFGYGRYYFRKNSSKYVSNNILHIDLSYNFDLRRKK